MKSLSAGLRLLIDHWAVSNAQELVDKVYRASDDPLNVSIFTYAVIHSLDEDKGNIARLILENEAMWVTNIRVAFYIIKNDAELTNDPEKALWIEKVLIPFLKETYKDAFK